MTFIDLFSGVGFFRKGMEEAKHECLGYCEIDPYARTSYENIFKESNLIGTDIRELQANDIPKADIWCAGFPCQDISISGTQQGFKGDRSSLFFTVTGLIRDTKEENRPQFLFFENVKNLLSVNRGFDFLSLLIELDEIGYDAEWNVVNSSGWVPQNRERIFILAHKRI